MASTAEHVPSEESRRILHVEDEPNAAKAAASLLHRRLGWSVDVARDGNDAIRMFDGGLHAIVIIDWNLSGSRPDGLELCRWLRSSSSSPAIIFATARTGLDDRLRAFDTGADDYLVKPFEPDELVARARAVVRRASVVPPAPAVPASVGVAEAGVAFTHRQNEIIECLIAGMANKEIASSFHCSIRNVEYHVGGILRRAGCMTRSELVARLWERKLRR